MANIDPADASRAVLIEVGNVLGAFRDKIVVVGGWVPELLYPRKGHIGSLDVDLAISPEAFSDDAYTTVRNRLTEAGYSYTAPPTRFTKQVKGAKEPTKVDLITGQYVTGKKNTHIQVNELQINGLRGLDLAFEASREIELSGEMPDGVRNTVRVRVVEPEAFVLIKAFAMDERAKEKDAYDVAFVLLNYAPDLATLTERLRPLLEGGLAREGYHILKAKFESLESVGPTHAARVYAGQGADFAQSQRAAFESAQELFQLTGS